MMTNKEISLHAIHKIHPYVPFTVIKMACVYETLVFNTEMLQENCSIMIPEAFDELGIIRDVYAHTDDDFGKWDVPSYTAILKMNSTYGISATN